VAHKERLPFNVTTLPSRWLAIPHERLSDFAERNPPWRIDPVKDANDSAQLPTALGLAHPPPRQLQQQRPPHKRHTRTFKGL
jgi:hypothetical protein